MAIELLWIDEPDEYVIRRRPRHHLANRAVLTLFLFGQGAAASVCIAALSYGIVTAETSALMLAPFAVVFCWIFYVQLWSWAWALGGEERLVVTRHQTELTRRYLLRVFDRALRVPGPATLSAAPNGHARTNPWKPARLGDLGVIVVETSERTFRFGMGADARAARAIVEAVHRAESNARIAREREADAPTGR